MKSYILLIEEKKKGEGFEILKKIMKIIRKIVSPILNLIAVIIFIMAIGTGACYLAKIEPRIVVSGSMEPSIQTGSLCFLDKKTKYEDVKTGDIVAFEAANKTMVTHRVITVTDSGLETKGDNNEVSDGITTTKDNFKGKTLFSIPKLGYVMMFLNQKKGKILTVTFVITFFLTNLIISAEEKEEKEEEEAKAKK